MPSVLEQNAVYLVSGDPDKEDNPTLMHPGLLGARFTIQHPVSRAAGAPVPRTKRYQIVRVDPAMAAVITLGSPAYWKDRANYVVTNDPANLNAIAGVFNNAPVKGNYTCVQQGGPGYPKMAAPAGNLVVIGGAIGTAATTAGAPATAALGVSVFPAVELPTATGRYLVDLNVDPAA